LSGKEAGMYEYYKKGSRRRNRDLKEYTYRPLGCRQYRCVQMEKDNKEAKTRNPLKHRRRYEEYGRPHRPVVKKQEAQKSRKEKKEVFSGIRAGTFLGYTDGLYKYLCPYCDKINSSFFKTPLSGCDSCYKVFSVEN